MLSKLTVKFVPYYKIKEEYFDGEKTIFTIKIFFKSLTLKKSSIELKNDKKLLSEFSHEDQLKITNTFIQDNLFKYELQQIFFDEKTTLALKNIQTGKIKLIKLLDLIQDNSLIKSLRSEHAFQLGYLLREKNR